MLDFIMSTEDLTSIKITPDLLIEIHQQLDKTELTDEERNNITAVLNALADNIDEYLYVSDDLGY